jgi:hypothetical protein
MTVYCIDCDNVHGATREKDPWKWRCLKNPTAPGFGFVHPQYSPDPPYERCSIVNRDGLCPDFTPLRQPPEKDAT